MNNPLSMPAGKVQNEAAAVFSHFTGIFYHREALMSYINVIIIKIKILNIIV